MVVGTVEWLLEHYMGCAINGGIAIALDGLWK